ncbi:hypothetical protein KRP22_013982 [Phytophthora ramorum]|nr:ATP-dependent translocase ABCB1 [Phytophthora ramorum]
MPKSPLPAPYAALATPRAVDTKRFSVAPNKQEDDTSLSFLALYRFATPSDKLQLVLGAVMGGLNGAIFPCMALVFGTAIDAFAQADGGVDRDAVNRAALYYFFIAVALFVTDCLAYTLFCNAAETQMKALRSHVFAHLLYMDVGWYDQRDAFELSSRITGDTVKIKDGMGQKLSDSIKFTCQFFVGYIIGFARGWDMTLVMACVMPVMVLSLKYMVRLFRKRAVLSQQMYAEAGAVAEETLGSIRTVASLNGETRAINKYNERAVLVETGNIAICKRSACVFGCMMGSVWLMYAAGLWYGGSKVARAEASPGTVFQAFFGVLMGTISLSQISPNITAVAEAKGAAATIYKILDTASAIDASRDDIGDKPEGSVLKEANEDAPEGTFTIVDALEFSRPERKFFITGLIAAGINGFSMPCSAILISEMVARAAVLLITNATQNFCFRYMAEKLTSRLRGIHFSALCRQNIAFFDEKKNATGALAADLSTNATKVAMISGDSQGRVVQAAFTFVAALVISFTTGSWLLTLVMLAVFPLLIMGQVIRMNHVRHGNVLSDELADVGAHASEALTNIRTVVSMGMEKSTTETFMNLLEEPLASGRREARLNGVALGFSSFIVFATYSLVFWCRKRSLVSW